MTLTGSESLGQVCALPASGYINVAFRQLNPDIQILSRDNPEARYTVDIPGNFGIPSTGNYIDLVTSHFPEVPDKPSALEIEINGRLLSAVALTKENASLSQARIDLPAGLLRAGSNSIVMRLETGATCDEPGAILNVVIDEGSVLSFGYQQTSYPVDLSLYPLPFAEKSLLHIPVIMVLPDQPAADSLAAAITLAAGLGQRSAGRIDLQAISASAFEPDPHGCYHLIVIGPPGSNNVLDELELPLPLENIILEPGQGVLEEMESPWNEYRLVLVVSGSDEQGMSKASQLLNLETRFPSIRGSSAVVTDFRPPSVEPGAPPPQHMTLASLGHGDETVYGAQLQSYSYDFTLPPGWQLTGPPVFVLEFSHANILDPDSSVIDVRLNGQPIGSTFLDDSNASEGEWTVPLPQRALQVGNNRLEIGVEMNLPGADDADRCRLLDDQRLWTVISGKSEISVPYAIVDFRPDLGYFPYPFGQDSGLGQTLFVLPDQANEAMIDDLIQLAVRLGSSSKTDYLPAYIAYASGTAQDVWQDHHLVLFGRPTENILLGEFNSYLPQPFADGSDDLELAATDGLGLRLDADREVGLLQVVNSPWNEEHALLAVTGTTDKGVHLAVQALLKPDHSLKGNLAVVDSVSGETDEITVYSVDTRPATSTDAQELPGASDSQGETPAEDTASNGDKLLLANRWWK